MTFEIGAFPALIGRSKNLSKQQNAGFQIFLSGNFSENRENRNSRNTRKTKAREVDPDVCNVWGSDWLDKDYYRHGWCPASFAGPNLTTYLITDFRITPNCAYSPLVI